MTSFLKVVLYPDHFILKEKSVKISALTFQGRVLLVLDSLVIAICTKEFFFTFSDRAELLIISKGLDTFLPYHL